MLNKKNIFFIIVFFSLSSFLIGLSTGRYQHFPYNFLYYLYNGYPVGGNFKPGGRNFNIDYYDQLDVDLNKKTAIFITYGQSNAANDGQLGYVVKNDVFQYVIGESFVYKDPSLGATGFGGSVWGMLGDKLIQNGYYDQVIFSNCGWSGKRIEELKEGHYFEYLSKNFLSLEKKYGRVDGVLFHQGEANNSIEGVKNYYKDFYEFILKLKSIGINVPVFLSRASVCGIDRPSNKTLLNIQNKLIADLDNVKKGPNTDLIIGKEFRLDGCHFTIKGYEVYSDLWFECLKTK